MLKEKAGVIAGKIWESLNGSDIKANDYVERKGWCYSR